MEVMNPFTRVPETEESLALACHCYCSLHLQRKLAVKNLMNAVVSAIP